MQLILDIDLNDDRFPAWLSAVFDPLVRLPLYYCCRCPPSNIYRVLSSDRLAVIRPDVAKDYDPVQDQSEETPFRNFPSAFARRRMELVPIPSLIASALDVANECDQISVLTQFLQREIVVSGDLVFSRMGGLPKDFPPAWENSCPNKECVANMTWYPYSTNESKFLIVFSVCTQCLTIQSDYRCT